MTTDPKQFVKRHAWFLIAFHRLILRRKSYLHRTGWVASLRRGYPCRADGMELPWMNYPTIRLLEERLTRDLTLFEFGTGHSTAFFAARFRCVHAVESHRDWLASAKARVPANVSVVHREADVDGSYCRAILEPGLRFDVVVVDGADRVNCVRQATETLSPPGVVILDDSSRGQYRAAFEHAKANGFRSLSLEGLKPTGDGIDRTTIFYRDGNCLGL